MFRGRSRVPFRSAWDRSAIGNDIPRADRRSAPARGSPRWNTRGAQWPLADGQLQTMAPMSGAYPVSAHAGPSRGQPHPSSIDATMVNLNAYNRVVDVMNVSPEGEAGSAVVKTTDARQTSHLNCDVLVVGGGMGGGPVGSPCDLARGDRLDRWPDDHPGSVGARRT